MPGLGCQPYFRRLTVLNTKAHPLALFVGLFHIAGLVYYFQELFTGSHQEMLLLDLPKSLQLLPNGTGQEISHGIHFVIKDLFSRHVHFSVFLVKLVLILFLFAKNKSGFWLQGSNC